MKIATAAHQDVVEEQTGTDVDPGERDSGSLPNTRPNTRERGSGSSPERVTFSLAPQAATALEKLVRRTGASKTDTINRALCVFEHIEALQHTGGAVYVRETSHGRLEKLRFF
jgi:hypothetical protein